MFVPFSNSKGAFVGTLSGLAITLWIFIGANAYGIKYPKKLFKTSGCLNQTNFCGSVNDTFNYELIFENELKSYIFYYLKFYI